MLTYLCKVVFLIIAVHLTWSLPCLTRCAHHEHAPLSNALIEHVNRKQTTWKAGVNFLDEDDSFIYRLTVKSQFDVQPTNNGIGKLSLYTHPKTALPDAFDARQYWPKCVTIGRVQDQGACKAGWAIAATEAMTDRYCTLSKNKNTYVNISAEDVISYCGISCGLGCEGGFPTAVWHYWVDIGIVTGGLYNTTSGCRPYSIKSCAHKLPESRFEPTTPLPNCGGEALTPVCSTKCVKNYTISYQNDLHYGQSAYAILPNVTQIQAEIYNHGPVQADMTIFGDFFSYKNGVYQHTAGDLIGQHSVKLIGWGNENKTDFWLAVNSWNKHWGDKGLFKILRGKNECGIENNVIAGTPKF